MGGKITLDEIPSKLKNDAIKFQLNAKGFVLFSEEEYILNGNPLTLKVRIDNSIGRIHGVVMDRNGLHLLDSAQIIINSDTFLYSNIFGKFDILLPESMWITDISNSYDLMINIEGYETEKEAYNPSSKPIEIRLFNESK